MVLTNEAAIWPLRDGAAGRRAFKRFRWFYAIASAEISLAGAACPGAPRRAKVKTSQWGSQGMLSGEPENPIALAAKMDALVPMTPTFLLRGALLVVACTASFLSGCQHVHREHRERATSGWDVFLLAGQSNMAGRGAVEAFDQLEWPNLLAIDASGEWRPAKEPLHFDKPAIVGVGPGSMFGRVLADTFPTRRIGLVPVACGGSSIEVWRPGAYHEGTQCYPYDQAVARARQAMKDGRLRAIVWIQGESDSSEERALLYYERLQELIHGLRRDLETPDVPFLIGRLPRFAAVSNDPGRARVDEAHRRAAREMAGVYYVDMPVLTALPDGIHADAPSAREMGRRLAEAYLDVCDRHE